MDKIHDFLFTHENYYSCFKNALIAAGVNNSATIGDGAVIGGNSTDRALMAFFLDRNYLHKRI